MSGRRRILYVDATQGAGGDMILGALLHLGVPPAPLRDALATLELQGWSLEQRSIERCGLVARKVDVAVSGEQPGRRFADIRRIVDSGDLAPNVRRRALAIFERLFEAEALVHGRTVEDVHLHEAGGTDAIVDIVGTALAIEHLRPDAIVVSPMTTGFGEVQCAHGRYPIPAPATASICRGFPVRSGDIEAERLTPTGAAILTALADDWGPMPLLRPIEIGYGAGSRDLGPVPNMLRMILGEAEDLPLAGKVVVLECTLDDATPQQVSHALRRVADAGALDAFTEAVMMKKGRVGHRVTVLARPEQLEDCAEVILRETTTLGLRYRFEQRFELERSIRRVTTRFGEIDVKVGRLGGRDVQAWPEFEQCAELAARHGVPLADVQQAALETHRADVQE